MEFPGGPRQVPLLGKKQRPMQMMKKALAPLNRDQTERVLEASIGRQAGFTALTILIDMMGKRGPEVAETFLENWATSELARYKAETARVVAGIKESGGIVGNTDVEENEKQFLEVLKAFSEEYRPMLVRPERAAQAAASAAPEVATPKVGG